MAAGTNGKKEFEGDVGNAGVSSDVNACIGVYPLASAQIAGGLFPQGQATPENIAAASPTTYISATFAPTIFIHGTKDGTIPVASSVDFFTKLHALKVPSTLTLIQGADHAFDNNAPDAVEVMAASIDLFLDRLIDQSAAVSVVRWRRRSWWWPWSRRARVAPRRSPARQVTGPSRLVLGSWSVHRGLRTRDRGRTEDQARTKDLAPKDQGPDARLPTQRAALQAHTLRLLPLRSPPVSRSASSGTPFPTGCATSAWTSASSGC